MIQFQESPNRWSCIPTAFAMVMGIPVADLLKSIGHDGSEIRWPGLPEPKCRRGFHIQELTAAASWLRFAVVPLCFKMVSLPTLESRPLEINFDIMPYIERHSGVLYRPGHAVAWDSDRKIILCPNRGELPFTSEWHTFFIVVPY